MTVFLINTRLWFRCLTTISRLSRIWHGRLDSKRVNLPTAECAKLGAPCGRVKNNPRALERGTLIEEEEMPGLNLPGMLGMGTLHWVKTLSRAHQGNRINNLSDPKPVLAEWAHNSGLAFHIQCHRSWRIYSSQFSRTEGGMEGEGVAMTNFTGMSRIADIEVSCPAHCTFQFFSCYLKGTSWNALITHGLQQLYSWMPHACLCVFKLSAKSGMCIPHWGAIQCGKTNSHKFCKL